jgi:hypothetical protein
LLFASKFATLSSKSKDWLVRNQDNISEWDGMSAHGLLFQLADIIKIQQSSLVWYKAHTIINPVEM